MARLRNGRIGQKRPEGLEDPIRVQLRVIALMRNRDIKGPARINRQGDPHDRGAHRLR